MPINTTPPDTIIPPSSADPSNFRVRADAFMAWLQSLANFLVTFISELNSTEVNINEKEASAVGAANIASAAANFQGEWTSKGYTLGQSVSSGSANYMCKLTHATGFAVTNTTYWQPTGIAAIINGSAAKTVPVDADLIGLADSAASFSLKKTTWGNIKTALGISTLSPINFTKPFQGAPLFTKASVSTITIPVGTSVKVGAAIITVSGSAYTLSLNSVAVGALDTGAKAAGTDYYVYALEAGGFILSANATNPTGYTTANSRKIGGFHYGVIPEGFTAINNIVAADVTMIAGINAYTFWDLKFMPSCGDARGMFKANTGKWYDLYLCNIDHHLHGTSSAGKTIAGGTILNGRNFPKIPTFYGGNGTTTYGTFTWFEAAELGKAYGKDLISYEEFAAIAYGVLEASSAGAADTGVTQHLANYTSKFGMCMATGCEWIWGKDLIGPVGAAWNTNTEGRGSIYNASLIAALFGGYRDNTVESGSRASFWLNTVWYSAWSFGSRYACDHLELA